MEVKNEDLVFIAVETSVGLQINQFLKKYQVVSGEIITREVTAETVKDELDRTFLPNGTQWFRWKIISVADYTGMDRTFRNAWSFSEKNPIDVDVPKAKELGRDKIRLSRIAAFAKLDNAYMRADETGNTGEKARIAQLKQKLRDAPADPRIAEATTPPSLKIVINTIISEMPQ